MRHVSKHHIFKRPDDSLSRRAFRLRIAYGEDGHVVSVSKKALDVFGHEGSFLVTVDHAKRKRGYFRVYDVSECFLDGCGIFRLQSSRVGSFRHLTNTHHDVTEAVVARR